MATKTVQQPASAAKPARKRRAPRAWYIADGIRVPLEQMMPILQPEKPARLSPAGEWLLKHPDGIGEIVDMRAVLK